MSVGECQYDMTGHNDLCGRMPAVDSEGMCIFHSRDKKKDLGAFRDAIRSKMDADFTGFMFPVPVEEIIFSGDTKGTTERGRFKKDIVLRKALLKKGIKLRGLHFEGFVDLSECETEGACDLRDCEFAQEVVFDRTWIHGGLDLSGALFTTLGESDAEACVRFTSVRMADSKKVKLHDVDLSRWLFLKTDVTNIDFRRCIWACVHPKSWDGRTKTKWMLHDEAQQKWEYRPVVAGVLKRCQIRGGNSLDTNRDHAPCYAEMLKLYRGLRQNYESKLAYPEAGDFHIGEMEARRLSLWYENGPDRLRRLFEYVAVVAYKTLSGYGERYVRTVAVLLSVILLFAFLFLFAGFSATDIDGTGFVYSYSLIWQIPTWNTIAGFWADFILHAFPYSTSVATLFLRDKYYVYSNAYGHTLFFVESFLGAVLLPLLVLGIRRYFRR